MMFKAADVKTSLPSSEWTNYAVFVASYYFSFYFIFYFQIYPRRFRFNLLIIISL